MAVVADIDLDQPAVHRCFPSKEIFLEGLVLGRSSLTSSSPTQRVRGRRVVSKLDWRRVRLSINEATKSSDSVYCLTYRIHGTSRRRNAIMRLTTIKNLVLISVLLVTLPILACGGGDESDTPTQSSEPAESQSSESSAPVSFVEGEPTVVGECQDGLTLRVGEGCQYSGHEGRPADIVISVGADGEICREKGSVMMSGFMVGMVRLCADKYAVVDVLEAEINFEPNGDGTWSVTYNQ